MILSGQTIKELCVGDEYVKFENQMIRPFYPRTVNNGMSFGLSYAGYDVRIAQGTTLKPGEFKLASTVEQFNIPNDVLGFVHDKSTWARRGLSLFNTVLEPGWRGYLTLEMVNFSDDLLTFEAGMPIAQIVFQRTDKPIDKPYEGKYQNQGSSPVPAIMEKEANVVTLRDARRPDLSRPMKYDHNVHEMVPA